MPKKKKPEAILAGTAFAGQRLKVAPGTPVEEFHRDTTWFGTLTLQGDWMYSSNGDLQSRICRQIAVAQERGLMDRCMGPNNRSRVNHFRPMTLVTVDRAGSSSGSVSISSPPHLHTVMVFNPNIGPRLMDLMTEPNRAHRDPSRNRQQLPAYHHFIETMYVEPFDPARGSFEGLLDYMFKAATGSRYEAYWILPMEGSWQRYIDQQPIAFTPGTLTRRWPR